jgi:hypothetical protein
MNITLQAGNFDLVNMETICTNDAFFYCIFGV